MDKNGVFFSLYNVGFYGCTPWCDFFRHLVDVENTILLKKKPDIMANEFASFLFS